jgi:nucleoside-diphosphate-sugar epimerase
VPETQIGRFDHLLPRNAYPESKRMTETLLRAYAEQYGLPYAILRLESVYGPGMRLERDGRAMSDLVGACLRGEDLVLNSAGNAVRAYCYVADAVRAILAVILRSADNEVYNISNPDEPLSIRELAETLIGLPGNDGLRLRLPEPTDVSAVPGTPAASYSSFAYSPLSIAKIEALGWRPEVGLRAGLTRTLESFRVAG